MFEKHKRLGGMLRYGIPSYRLPDDDLDRDINAILSTGIQVKLDVDIGREITFDQIRSEYDSVYIAIGAQIVNRMNIPGQDSEGVLSAVELLGAVGAGEAPDFTASTSSWWAAATSPWTRRAPLSAWARPPSPVFTAAASRT